MRVSVVMSTYNDSACLAGSVESVLGQDFTDFEFIIVNDGSPGPRTAEILSDYARRDPRIRVITKANEGLTRALIDGCAAAQGEYIARLDVGDMMTPDRLRRQAAVLDEHADVVFVSCWTEFCGPEWEYLWTEKGPGNGGQRSEVGGKPTNDTNRHEGESGDCVSVGRASVSRSGVSPDSEPDRVPEPVERVEGPLPDPAPRAAAHSELGTQKSGRSDLPRVWLGNVLPDTPGDNLKAGPTCHPSVMMRADAYRAAGGYRWQFYYGQDWDLWYRLAEHGKLAFVPTVLYRCRVFPNGISMTQVERQRLLAACIQEAAQARRQGKPEEPLLMQVALVRPGVGRARRDVPWWQRGAGLYFIASCLMRNGDPRCRRYFRESLTLNPWRAKAWFGLVIPLSGKSSR